MELKKLLIGLEGLKVKGNLDLDINGIEKNSRVYYNGYSLICNKCNLESSMQIIVYYLN